MANMHNSTFAVLGKRLLATFVGLLIVARGIIELFFPQLRGAGLNVVTLTILIPIWSIGVVAIVMLLMAWISEPSSDVVLDFKHTNVTEQPGGRLFSRFTKGLAALTASLTILGSLGVFREISNADSPWTIGIAIYAIDSISIWIIYLAVFYTPSTHRATTTFQNLFTPLFAALLVPLAWPFLIVFNMDSIARQRGSETEIFHIAENDEWDR